MIRRNKGRRSAPAVERLEDRRLLTVTITEYPIPTAQSEPAGIALGPDGNLWFTESAAGKIGAINPQTTNFQEFSIPNGGSTPLEIAVGPDGALWFTDQGGNAIAEIATSGNHTIQEYPIPSGVAFPYGIALGPDNNVWFTETNLNAINDYDATTHAFGSGFSAPSSNAEPYGITAGPSGDPNIYFTEQLGSAIGIFNTQTQAMTAVPTPTTGSNPSGIAVGPDGNLWFTEGNADKIGVLNRANDTITEYAIPTPNSVPNAIALGADGNLWFTEAAGNEVGEITPSGQITEYPLPTANSQPDGIAAGPNGTLWITAQGVNDIAVVNLGVTVLAAPTLASQDDTGVSNSDGITQNNGTAAAPLDFTATGVSPASGFVTFYDNGHVLAGPVQATNGTAAVHVAAATGLPDGTYQITYTTSPTATGSQSTPSAPFVLSIQTSLTITGTNPADGAVVSALPGGQVIVTFSHPLAGLTDGESPIQNTAPFNPYDVFLLARGPDGVFSASSGVDAGDLPLHANVVYHVNADGTSEFVITPTAPLSSDVYAVSVNLSAFSDLAGNHLTDGNNGYRTFLLQLPPVNSGQPLQVTGVTEFNGFAAINNNVVFQPDTIQIHFNKPLYAGAAGNGNVQLIANPGSSFTVVPSVAAYSPSTDSIELTPTALLTPGTTYAVRVLGQDSGTTSVSDDQGYGFPGYPLAHTFYDSFQVRASTLSSPNAPFRVATNNGNPALLPIPSTTSEWQLPVGYASVQFTEALDTTSLGRFSAMLIPRSGGLDSNNFDAGDVPLNATIAFNPNTNQLIIVPSQPVGNDVYLFSLSNMSASASDPLLNNAGQPAGVSGNAAYFATFGLQVQAASSSVVIASRSAADHVLATVVVPRTTVSTASTWREGRAAAVSAAVAGRPRPVQPLVDHA